MSTPDAPNLPLEGYRVLDLGQYVAAPSATMLLRELGAEVIMVEPVGGSAARHLGPFGQAMMMAYTRGKKSIAVNLRTPGGREAILRVIKTVDAVVHNMRPGLPEKLGLDPDSLRQANSQVIIAEVSGFGTQGPSKHRPAYDSALQAESGLMWITGEHNREPLRVGSTVIDTATGHVAAQGIIAALLKRARGGEPEIVHVSMLETALHLQAINWAEYLITGNPPHRHGNPNPSIAPSSDLMETQDGYLMLSAYVNDHWAKLCELIERPDMITDERFKDVTLRAKNRDAMTQELNPIFRQNTTNEWIIKLNAAGVVAGEVRDYPTAMASADVVANRSIWAEDVSVDSIGPVQQFGFVQAPYQFASRERRSVGLPPATGEHTRSILAEVGYTPTQIRTLFEDSIVNSAES